MSAIYRMKFCRKIWNKSNIILQTLTNINEMEVIELESMYDAKFHISDPYSNIYKKINEENIYKKFNEECMY